MIKNLALIATIAIMFTACSERGPAIWTAWIYPDKTNTKRSMEIGTFPSLELCRAASLDKLKTLDLGQRGDYKCGLGCGYNEGLKTLICERTSK